MKVKDMFYQGGFAERQCLMHCARIEHNEADGNNRYEFFHTDGEHSAIYDMNARSWVN